MIAFRLMLAHNRLTTFTIEGNNDTKQLSVDWIKGILNKEEKDKNKFNSMLALIQWQKNFFEAKKPEIIYKKSHEILNSFNHKFDVFQLFFTYIFYTLNAKPFNQLIGFYQK
jgi:hypothetical protein